MLFRELNRGKCKTYLVACTHTRKAALIDPLRSAGARWTCCSTCANRTSSLASSGTFRGHC